MEDREIIELYFQRDESAITQTELKYGQYCYSVANHILDNHHDSEECVNDTWLHTWNTIPPKFPSSLRLFVGRIARNLAFDRYKHQVRLKRGGASVTLALEEIADIVSDTEEADSLQSEQALMCAVNEFLRSLSERDRNIFLNRYYYVKSSKEIAHKYRLKEDTVQKILYRTRVKLKEYLTDKGYKL